MRPGCSAVTASGSGVVTSFHHEVDGRSGMPERVADEVAAVAGLGEHEARLAAPYPKPPGESGVVGLAAHLVVEREQVVFALAGFRAGQQPDVYARHAGHARLGTAIRSRSSATTISPPNAAAASSRSRPGGPVS